jgi:malonyl-CoA O-methyltransferase
MDAFRLLADSYDQSPNPMVALEQRLVEALLPPLQGLLVADVAAGTGRWAEYCRWAGAQTVALDFSPEMLARAPGHRVLADMRRLPLRAACADLTICAFGFGYAPNCLDELARVTRPGGTVLLSDVHPEGLRRGWKRLFQVSGETIEIASEVYVIGDLEIAGLKLVALWEAAFGEPERHIFAGAGKLDAFEEASRHAAIFVAQWIKS